jgi:hypothetical protein
MLNRIINHIVYFLSLPVGDGNFWPVCDENGKVTGLEYYSPVFPMCGHKKG